MTVRRLFFYYFLRFASAFSICLVCSADELDAATTTATGGDTAAQMRRLEDALERLRDVFKEAKGLATGSEEAAAKCQVQQADSTFFLSLLLLPASAVYKIELAVSLQTRVG